MSCIGTFWNIKAVREKIEWCVLYVATVCWHHCGQLWTDSTCFTFWQLTYLYAVLTPRGSKWLRGLGKCIPVMGSEGDKKKWREVRCWYEYQSKVKWRFDVISEAKWKEVKWKETLKAEKGSLFWKIYLIFLFLLLCSCILFVCLCILFVMYDLFFVFCFIVLYSVSCFCFVYCLCVTVCCTAATGCQPNCS